MKRKEYERLIQDVEVPLGWDPRGTDEEAELAEKAQESWDEIKKLLKKHVEPLLENG